MQHCVSNRNTMAYNIKNLIILLFLHKLGHASVEDCDSKGRGILLLCHFTKKCAELELVKVY